MDPKSQLKAIFSDEGPLKRHFPRFQYRLDQYHLAERVLSQLLKSQGQLVVEAGTGTGKSLAYLAAAFCAQKQVLISTGTLALQDQLYQKDIPHFFNALALSGWSVPKVVLMKGRANYLCWQRLETHAPSLPLLLEQDENRVNQIIQWSEITETGDRSELDFLSEDNQLWQEIDARSEFCLGRKCPHYNPCFVTRLREEAQHADWIIVNHALLCADRLLRIETQKNTSSDTDKKSFGQVLPDVDAWIIDEAHLLEEISSKQFGFSISPGRLQRLHSDLQEHQSLMSAPSKMALTGFYETLKTQFWEMLSPWTPSHQVEEGRLLTDAYTLEQRENYKNVFNEALKGIQKIVSEIQNEVTSEEELILAEIDNLEKRASRLAFELNFILSEEALQAGFVAYGQPDRDHVLLMCAPVDVSQVLEMAFWSSSKPFVLTSASISVAGKVAPFCQRLGLYDPREPTEDLETAVLPSPFDFENRCGLYLPEGMPAPTAPGFRTRFDDEVMGLLDLSDGGAFLLFTSYRAMRATHERLAHRLLLRGIEVLMQGQKPKMMLLEDFKTKSEKGAVVLLATHSFWQGVDVQGKALRLVVIDRLPFKPPVDPLQRAKTQWIQRQNRSPFNDLALPQAAQILKQGTGRLMRHVNDAGIVAIMDGRLTQKSYGRTLMRSLPPFKALDSFAACERFWIKTVIPALDLPDVSDLI